MTTAKHSSDYEALKLPFSSLPEASGLFVDNSGGDLPVADNTARESLATYATDYGSLLAAIGQSIGPRRWILANTAGNSSTNADGAIRFSIWDRVHKRDDLRDLGLDAR